MFRSKFYVSTVMSVPKQVFKSMFFSFMCLAFGAVSAHSAHQTGNSHHTMDSSQTESSGQITDMKNTEIKDKAHMAVKSDTVSSTVSQAITAKMNALLKRHIDAPDAQGIARFDYAALKGSPTDRAALQAYINALEAVDPNTLTEKAAIAYWANLYNAVTLEVVIEHYPVSSIKKIRSGAFSAGPWKKDLVSVKGKPMSLDDIEHGVLRKQYPSPLIHYMVNCASLGCPNLKNTLWKAETLDIDRKKAAQDFINAPRGVRITSKGLILSSIYDWFQEDFGGSKAGVLDHIKLYANGKLKAELESGATLKGFDYDWALNE